MTNFSSYRYIDTISILILGGLIAIAIGLSMFFFSLGGFGYLIGSLFLAGIIKSINHVVLFKQNFLVVKHLLIIRRVPVQDAQMLKCEITGLGRSRDVLIYLYYENNGKKNKAIFLHFRFLGYKKIANFLNQVNNFIDIDSKSFEIVGIKRVEGVYEIH